MNTKSCVCAMVLVSALAYTQNIKKNNNKTTSNFLNEVIVTDSKFKLKRYESGKPIIKITSKELRKNPSMSILDILNQKSGIEINGARSNAGQNLGYFIRGGGTSQVLIRIDGIAITNPGGFSPNYDLRFLSPANVESIEVLKGASSSLYGSSASTAVINIITKKTGNKPIEGYLSTTFGTNQAFDHQDYKIATTRTLAGINGQLGKISYATGLGYDYTDGLSAAMAPSTNESDRFNKYNMNARLGYQGEKLKLNTIFDLNNFRNEFDGGSFLDNAKNYADNKQYRIGVNASYAYGKSGSVQTNAAYDNYSINSVTAFPSETIAHSFISDIYNKYIISKKIYSILGLGYQSLTAEIPNSAKVKENKNTSQIAPYINMVYLSDFGLNLNLGLRVNNHSKYGSNVVYQINPSYYIKIKEKALLKIFGTYGTSFTAPVAIQLFHPTYGNENLNPEISQTLELGSSIHLPKWRGSLVYFNQNFQNKISFNSAFKYINLDSKASTSGLELELAVNASKKLNLVANYTLTEVDKKVVRVPRNKVHTSIDYKAFSKTNFQISFDYVGSRSENKYDPATFSSTLISLDPFSLINIGVSQQLIDNQLKANLSLSNLLNENYMEVYGYSTRGRNILASLQYTF